MERKITTSYESSIRGWRLGPVRCFRVLIDQLRILIDLVFGYDYFISYSHSDGANYPRTVWKCWGSEPFSTHGFIYRGRICRRPIAPGATLLIVKPISPSSTASVSASGTKRLLRSRMPPAT